MVSSPDVIKIFETSIANDIQKKKPKHQHE
jgi:hypothetical protein